MCLHINVEWTIGPKHAPSPVIHCSLCGTAKPFVASGKARLNANGRRLDAWLIYKCPDCDRSWNRPIFERQAVRSLDPGLLSRLEANDPDLIESLAFDVAALRRHAGRVVHCDSVRIAKRRLPGPEPNPGNAGGPAACACKTVRVTITLGLVQAVAVRLDRLLAIGLGLSRSAIARLAQTGAIDASAGEAQSADWLKRPPRLGQRITLILGDDGSAAAIAACAAGQEARAP